MKGHKRLLAMLLALIMLVLAACGGADGAPDNTETGTPAASADAGADDVAKKVLFIVSQRLGDEGPVDLLYSGVARNVEKYGFEETIIEAQPGEYEESMIAMIEDGYRFIVAMFPQMQDAVRNVAAQYPEVMFVHGLCDQEGMDNVKGMVGYEQEASFLCGVLAARTTEVDHIGFVGGVDNPDIHRFLDGFEEGARYITPDIQLDVTWTGSFEDVAKGKELALTLYNNGCDVIFGSGGKTCLGYYDAVKEAGPGNYVIGVDVNHNHRADGQVLGSLVCYYDKWMDIAFEEYLSGNFIGDNHVYTITTGHMDLELNDETHGITIPEELQEEIEEIRQKIFSGEIKVQSMPDVQVG